MNDPNRNINDFDYTNSVNLNEDSGEEEEKDLYGESKIFKNKQSGVLPVPLIPLNEDEDGEVFSKILDNLYLGCYYSKFYLEKLKKEQISIIINCAVNIRCEVPNIESFHVPIYDEPSNNISEKYILELLEKGYEKICEFIKEKKKVLVVCKKGVSRSATLVIYYLMKTKKLSYDECFKFVEERRNVIQPIELFENMLKILKNKNCKKK